MNWTHATVGVGATSSTAWLTTLMTGWHGLDSDHAAACAGLVTLVGAAVLTLAWRVVLHNWPWLAGTPAA